MVDLVVETIFDHVVAGVPLHFLHKFLLIYLQHLSHHVLFQAHVGPVGKQIFDVALVASELVLAQVEATHHLCRVLRFEVN